MHTHSHPHASPTLTEGRLIRWASFYDTFTNILTLGHIGMLRSMTVDLSQLKPGEKVLDVGCGTGGVTIPAKQRVGPNGTATGVDPAPEMIAVAKKKAARAGLEVDFRIGVIESLPYPDSSFDVVTSSLMMHHLPHEVQVRGLTEIRRVLKPGGRIFIADMLRLSKSLHDRLFATLTLHGGRIERLGIQDLPKIMEDAGFENVQLLKESFLTIGFLRANKPAA
ncbi:MAG: methyltransferase domain-containing protein [Chloroflexi bacterium]|nr:methyltransferase domain-containing protein [Chloroflexota bacterium]